MCGPKGRIASSVLVLGAQFVQRLTEFFKPPHLLLKGMSFYKAL